MYGIFIFVSFLALIDDAIQDVEDSAVIHPAPCDNYPESEVSPADHVILWDI